MKYEDIFKIYPHKEDKPVNVDPKLLATARREDLAIRHKKNGITLVDAREIKKVAADISEVKNELKGH